MAAENEVFISLEEAKKQVEIASRRIALLHISYARTLVEELGEEEGMGLIAKAIRDYGVRIGERTRKEVLDRGLEPTPENFGAGRHLSVPRFGMHERSERVWVGGERRRKAYDCVLAKLWKECGEEKLGRLYCYVDVAKYMAYNPNYKMVHIGTVPDGDEYCEFAVRPTIEKEREDFSGNKAWFYIDE